MWATLDTIDNHLSVLADTNRWAARTANERTNAITIASRRLEAIQFKDIEKNDNDVYFDVDNQATAVYLDIVAELALFYAENPYSHYDRTDPRSQPLSGVDTILRDLPYSIQVKIHPLVDLRNSPQYFKNELIKGGGITYEGAIGSAPSQAPTVLPDGTTAVPGPQGPQGERGERGPQGERGERGPQGEPGRDGTGTGTGTGVPGPQGEKGDTGDRGPQGERGFTGPDGPRGQTGSPGEQGDRGPQGSMGADGARGEQGIQGERGERGFQGIQGERGEKGDRGDTGPQGERGLPGQDGTGGGGGSVTNQDIDNRIADWAENGNVSPIPLEKLRTQLQRGVYDLQEDNGGEIATIFNASDLGLDTAAGWRPINLSRPGDVGLGFSSGVVLTVIKEDNRRLQFAYQERTGEIWYRSFHLGNSSTNFRQITGSAAVDARIATWARNENLEDIPLSKTRNTVAMGVYDLQEDDDNGILRIPTITSAANLNIAAGVVGWRSVNLSDSSSVGLTARSGSVRTLIKDDGRVYQTFYQEDNGSIWYRTWTGFNAPDFTQVSTSGGGGSGTPGPQGERGERGLQGIQGIQGIPGADGADGQRGERGEMGLQGIQGIQGERGEQGPPGEGGGGGGEPLSQLILLNTIAVPPIGSRSNEITVPENFADYEFVEAINRGSDSEHNAVLISVNSLLAFEPTNRASGHDNFAIRYIESQNTIFGTENIDYLALIPYASSGGGGSGGGDNGTDGMDGRDGNNGTAIIPENLLAFSRLLDIQRGAGTRWDYLDPYPSENSRMVFASILGNRRFSLTEIQEITPLAADGTALSGISSGGIFFYENPNDPLNSSFPEVQSYVIGGVHLHRVTNEDTFLTDIGNNFMVMFDYTVSSDINSDVSMVRFGNTAEPVIALSGSEGIYANIGTLGTSTQTQTITKYAAEVGSQSNTFTVEEGESVNGARSRWYIPQDIPTPITVTVGLQAINNGVDAGTTVHTITINNVNNGTSNVNVSFGGYDDGIAPITLGIQYVIGEPVSGENVVLITPQTPFTNAAVTYRLSVAYAYDTTVQVSSGAHARQPLLSGRDRNAGDLFDPSLDNELRAGYDNTVMLEFTQLSSGYIGIRALINGVVQNDGAFFDTRRTPAEIGLGVIDAIGTGNTGITIGNSNVATARLYVVNNDNALSIAQLQEIYQHRNNPGLNYYNERANDDVLTIASILRAHDDKGETITLGAGGGGGGGARPDGKEGALTLISGNALTVTTPTNFRQRWDHMEVTVRSTITGEFRSQTFPTNLVVAANSGDLRVGGNTDLTVIENVDTATLGATNQTGGFIQVTYYNVF